MHEVADMNTLVTAGEDGTVRIWDITSPSRHVVPVGAQPLSSHRGIAVRSLAISPNRRIAASGDVSGIVRLWDLDRNHLSPLGPTSQRSYERDAALAGVQPGQGFAWSLFPTIAPYVNGMSRTPARQPPSVHPLPATRTR